MQGHIEVLVGARALPSIDTVLGTVPRKAERARAAAERALNQMGRGAFKGLEQESARAAAKTVSDQTRAVLQVARIRATTERQAERERVAAERRVAAEQLRALKEQQRERAKAAADEARLTRAQQRQEEYWHRARASSEQRRMRDEQRQTREAARRTREEQRYVENSFAYRTAYHGIIRYAPSALHRGARVANDLLRGAGVDFSLQSSVGRGVTLESDAVALSNSAFMEGHRGPAGRRVSPAELVRFARENAVATRLGSDTTMSGLREFVGRTGDLATARAALPGLLKLAKATRTDPKDVLSFAGTTAATWWSDLAGSEQEAAERARLLHQVMNIGAASGKLGTVEFEHLAAQGPKLAAAAQAFTGDKAQNVADMIALAQMGLSGGAANPTQAATSVAAMVNTLRTPGRMRAFAKNFERAERQDALFRDTFGKGFALEAGAGKFRSAQDLILASIVAAGTDTARFKRMWMNVQGARDIEGLRQRYLEAGGGKEGLAAVRAEFSKFGKPLSETELNQSFAAAMNTAASRAVEFQEKLDLVVSRMADDVLPKLSELAPLALQTVEAFSKVAAWAAENPGRAITLAIVASIARAGVESAVRLALERVLSSAARAALGGGGAAGLGGGIGGPPLLLGGGGATVPAGSGRLARLGAGAMRVGAGALQGYVGYQLGQTVGDVTGDQDAGGVAASMLAPMAAGAAFGPAGVIAGTALGVALSGYQAAQGMGGGGAVWEGIKSLFTEGSFFKGIDSFENAKAREKAASAPTPVQATSQPLAVKADFDPSMLSAAVRAGIYSGGVMRAEIVNLPSAPGSALEPPRVSSAGRSREL